jgi:rhodanese-related sulfurtransferase
MKAESREQEAERKQKTATMAGGLSAQKIGGALLPSAFCLLTSIGGALLLSAFCLLPSGCRTIGVSRTSGGYSEISPTVAADMILDSQQIVVIDVRSSADYRGPEGHIAGAINAPFDSIEMRLPELLPYQNQTVLVYGETSTDGAAAAQLLTVAGFRNIVHVNGGIKQWIERGYRTVNAQ